MAEQMKITGTIVPASIVLDQQGTRIPGYRIAVELPLRDLFAAFALAAVVGLNLEESTHESDACYAYNAADAMLKARSADATITAREGME
jgi:hypothetical protein